MATLPGQKAKELGEASSPPVLRCGGGAERVRQQLYPSDRGGSNGQTHEEGILQGKEKARARPVPRARKGGTKSTIAFRSWLGAAGCISRPSRKQKNDANLADSPSWAPSVTSRSRRAGARRGKNPRSKVGEEQRRGQGSDTETSNNRGTAQSSRLSRRKRPTSRGEQLRQRHKMRTEPRRHHGDGATATWTFVAKSIRSSSAGFQPSPLGCSSRSHRLG